MAWGCAESGWSGLSDGPWLCSSKTSVPDPVLRGPHVGSGSYLHYQGQRHCEPCRCNPTLGWATPPAPAPAPAPPPFCTHAQSPPSSHRTSARRVPYQQIHVKTSRTLSANTCQDLSSPPLSSSSSSGRVAKCSGNVANALAREALGQVGRRIHTHRDRERGLYTHIIDCTYTYIHIDYTYTYIYTHIHTHRDRDRGHRHRQRHTCT